jgi:hypothetical protein
LYGVLFERNAPRRVYLGFNTFFPGAATIMLSLLIQLSPLATILGFLIGLPTMIGAYYQSFKARQEANQAREGTLHTLNCLEFVSGDGSCINLVPLETLHSLPKAGDVILLPGHGMGGKQEFLPGAYLVESIEHIYSKMERKGSRPQEARLTKAVAHVTSLNPALTV